LQRGRPPKAATAADGEAKPEAASLLDAADRFVAETLQKSGKPAILALNKVDTVRDKRLLLPLLEEWGKLHDFRAIVPISALFGDGVERLCAELLAAVPEGPPLFPEEMVTDRAERWLAAELIREQIFLLTRQEVPYAVAVTIDNWEDRLLERGHKRGQRRGAFIDATIHVEKEAQKRIVVGEGGHLVRDVGIAARAEIGKLLGCPVHLSLFVRVDPDWTQSPATLRDMGYDTAEAARRARTPSPKAAE
jgi:GTP-binding protein Era